MTFGLNFQCIPLPYSGLFCENPPPMILLQTSPCDQSDCQNSAQCIVVAGEPICRCLPGFYGNKCHKIATAHFLGRDAYVELPSTRLRPSAHISLQVRAIRYRCCILLPIWRQHSAIDSQRKCCVFVSSVYLHGSLSKIPDPNLLINDIEYINYSQQLGIKASAK